MRTSAITLTIVALALSASNLPAEDDFSALLADLSFGNFPSVDEPLSVAKKESAVDLQPVPSGITMPALTAPAETTPSPQVALKDPIPVVQPKANDQVDFDDVFALQDPEISAIPEVNAIPVGHGLISGGHGLSDSCNPCDANRCDDAVVCRPRNPVVLPSSTLLQYFRSNACNTNVWDGYQQPCGAGQKHLRGECDCFNQTGKHGGSNCASCDGCR